MFAFNFWIKMKHLLFGLWCTQNVYRQQTKQGQQKSTNFYSMKYVLVQPTPIETHSKWFFPQMANDEKDQFDYLVWCLNKWTVILWWIFHFAAIVHISFLYLYFGFFVYASLSIFIAFGEILFITIENAQSNEMKKK